MSSRPSTSTSETASPPTGRSGLRRSFTLPTTIPRPQQQQPPEIGSAQGIETLFVHPCAKVLSFSAASSLRSRPSSRSSVASYDSERDGSGSLPWSSPTERTMAAGPLQIYRVPGSVSFLHSGNLLHAILPRSQCWLVDGVSKFAMRVLPNTYYRIELPANNQEDLDLVEQLKTTFTKVLYYERTSCPFERSFGADLPEMPSSNTRRMSRLLVEPAKRWKLDKVWKPEANSDQDNQYLRPDRIYYSDTDRSENEDNESNQEEHENKQEDENKQKHSINAEEHENKQKHSIKAEENENGQESPVEAEATDQLVRPRSRDNKQPNLLSRNPAVMRSVTAPPQLSLHSSPPSKVRRMAGLFNQQSRETTSQLLAPKLPPTPESMQDEFVASLSREPIIESSDESANEGAFDDMSVNGDTLTVSRDEPLIIVQEPENEVELEQAQESGEEEEDTVLASIEQKPTPNGTEQQPTWIEAKQEPLSREVEQKPTSNQVEKQSTSNEAEEQHSTSSGAEQQPTLIEAEQQPAPIEAEKQPTSPPTSIKVEHSPIQNETKQESPSIQVNQQLPPSRARQQSKPQQPSQPTKTRSPSPSATSTTSHDSWSSLPVVTPAEANDLLRRRSPSSTTTSSSSSSSSSSSPPTRQTSPKHRPQQVALTQTGALLVRKTCALFLGPPANLVATMLRIAAKIVASGALNLAEPAVHDIDGGRLKGHRRVPGSWDLSDDDEDWGF